MDANGDEELIHRQSKRVARRGWHISALELSAIYLMVLALARAVPAALMCKMLAVNSDNMEALATGSGLVGRMCSHLECISNEADKTKKRCGGTTYQEACEQEEEEDKRCTIDECSRME
jgi:hypothetical protein